MINLPSQEELSEACAFMPLFPIPQVVLLPNTLLRLHVFEPRYVQLLEDSLQSNRLMAIPRLASGWETSTFKPPLHATAGVGLVIDSVSLPQNRYNIALLGMGRIRINEEHESDRLYRIATADLLANIGQKTDSWKQQKKSICMLLAQLVVQNPELSGILQPLLEIERPPEQFLNCLAHLLLQDADKRQEYLELSELNQASAMIEEALSLALLGGAVIQE